MSNAANLNCDVDQERLQQSHKKPPSLHSVLSNIYTHLESANGASHVD